MKSCLSLGARIAALALTCVGSFAAQPRPAPAAATTVVGGVPLSEVARSRIETPQETHWAGELFPFTLRATVSQRVYSSVASDFEWAPDDLIFQEWSAPQTSQNGSNVEVYRTTRGYMKMAGTVRLPDTQQVATLVTSYAGDRSAVTDRFIIPTSGPVVRVKALPTPAPAAFNGAVGDFVIESTLSKTEVNVGDSVTWTVRLHGVGNWPEITRLPARVVPKDVQAMAPVLKREFAENAVFEGALTEDVLLLPSRAGAFVVGPLRFVFFDPREGKYQLYTSQTHTLQVAEGKSASEQVTKTPDGRTLVPVAPPLLPLDPESSRVLGRMPLSPALLLAAIVCGLIVVAGCWLKFARERSLRTDPLYPRRRAFAELEALMAVFKKSGHSPEELRRHLYAWQKHVAELAGIATAMPGAEAIAAALEGADHRSSGSSWVTLWQEANRAIYGSTPTLPYDWEMRASAALSDIKLKPVPFAAVFLRCNLLPYAAALALVAALCTQSLHAAPVEDYNKGDFAAAEKGWRELAAKDPLDAHLRYNLALAASQQNRWSESVALSLAAFSLAPRDPSIQWQFALSLERSGIENPAFTGFAGKSLKYRIARLFSPSEWTLVGCLAAIIGGVSGGLLLLGWYRMRSWKYRAFAGGGALACALVVCATWMSLHCWGPLAEPATVVIARNSLLCSVPTEIDVTQKTVPLPAGTLAKVDRTFLGWSRLVFPNQQTGWARTDAIVPLYR